MSEIIQGSPEWFAIRCGKVTASRVADVIAKIKSGWGASRASYMAELRAERFTGAVVQSLIATGAMQWGIAQEATARDAYEFRTDCEVELVGFVEHPTIPMAGASPDGFVKHIGSPGLVEIKCPNTTTHLDTLEGKEIAGKYITQMQWQMACSGRKWCDFVSFDPRMREEHLRLFIKRIPRDEETIAKLESEVIDFLAELNTKVAAIRELYEKPAA